MSTGTPDLSIIFPEVATMVAFGAVSYGSYKWVDSRMRKMHQLRIAKQEKQKAIQRATQKATQEMQKATHEMQGRLQELDWRKEDFPQLYRTNLSSAIWSVKYDVTRTPRAKMTFWRSKLLEREALALESRLNAWIQEENTAPVSEGVKLAK